MASLRTTSTSCLGCVARRSLTAVRPTIAITTTSNPFITLQTRGKKQHRNPDGVVVRLLEDVTRFGRRDTILRVARGRMRNKWFPDGTAEYVTASRLAALGYASAAEAVVPADSSFVARGAVPLDIPPPPKDDRITLKTVTAARAATLLETLLPAQLEFARKPISSSSATDSKAIFGSVSADDVATALREVLRASQTDDEDVMLLRIEARDVRFVVPEGQDHELADADRIKTLGRFEVEITVRGSGGSDGLAGAAAAAASLSGVPPIRRTVIVKAQE